MKAVIQTMTRIEAIALFAAYAQTCAREHTVPLTFDNWLRNRRIKVDVPFVTTSRIAQLINGLRGRLGGVAR